MLKIDKNNIVLLTKGDSAVLELSLKAYFDNGFHAPYFPTRRDSIVLTLKESADHCSKVILKKDMQELSLFVFNPEDTRHLHCGIYYYDVQLITEDGEIYTVIPPSIFELLPEVNDE